MDKQALKNSKRMRLIEEVVSPSTNETLLYTRTMVPFMHTLYMYMHCMHTCICDGLILFYLLEFFRYTQILYVFVYKLFIFNANTTAYAATMYREGPVHAYVDMYCHSEHQFPPYCCDCTVRSSTLISSRQ